MVGVENMARQRILIKGYVYLAIRGETLALVGNAVTPGTCSSENRAVQAV